MPLVSAIVIYAPYAVQKVAVPLMRIYAPNDFARVPPHITVLFPFVPAAGLAAVAPRLREIGGRFAPFEVTMRGYGQFPGVMYLQPADPTPIQAIFRAIYDEFPDYPPYGGQFGEQITPHMTVGTFADEAAQQAATFPDYEPLTFRADRLHLIYGDPQEKLPWLTYDVIVLGIINAHL